MGQEDSSACQDHLTTIKEVCQDLGIPLAMEKLEGSSQCITFLGIILDIEHMEARLPPDKLSRIRSQLLAWIPIGRRLRNVKFCPCRSAATCLQSY